MTALRSTPLRFTGLRATALVLAAAILSMASSSTDEEPMQPPLTVAQVELVDWAESRFEAAGLSFPTVTVVFNQSTLDCGGHKGLYFPSDRLLEMCGLDRRTMLHELAHAWAGDNLTDEARDRFVAHRGVDSWNDHDVEWANRGTEHFAETMMWALLDDEATVRWIEDDGEPTRRLLTIADSAPDRLAEGYELVVGRDLPARPGRGRDTARGASDVGSPEAGRAQGR